MTDPKTPAEALRWAADLLDLEAADLVRLSAGTSVGIEGAAIAKHYAANASRVRAEAARLESLEAEAAELTDERASLASAMVAVAMDHMNGDGTVTRERGATTFTIAQYSDAHDRDCVIEFTARVIKEVPEGIRKDKP